MPFYTYRCPPCDRTEEALLPFALRDHVDHVPRCPKKPWHPFSAPVVMVRVPFAVPAHGHVINPAVPRSRRA